MRSVGDLTDREFERLTVLGRADDERNGASRWYCRCVCGRLATVRGANLTSGAIVSCGCWRREVQRARARARNVAGRRDCTGHLTSDTVTHGGIPQGRMLEMRAHEGLSADRERSMAVSVVHEPARDRRAHQNSKGEPMTDDDPIHDPIRELQLNELMLKAKAAFEALSPDEQAHHRHAQRISWAVGQTAMSSPEAPIADVRAAAARAAGPCPCAQCADRAVCENPSCVAPCAGRDVECWRCWAHPRTSRRCHCA